MRRELKTIEPDELETLLEQEDGNTVLLDIRDKMEIHNEFEDQANVVNIPLKLLPSQLELLAPFKNKTVVLVCRSGMRASRAQKLLETEGFTDLRVLKGGVVKWEGFKKERKG